MPSERDLQISPIVPESVIHNTKTLSNLQSLTSSLFGVSAGVLGLESYYGFLVYIVFSFITTLLFYVLKVAPESLPKGHAPLDPTRFYRGFFDFWAGGLERKISGICIYGVLEL
ncbi:hypothetical protein F66182_7268 [Fusarium sp. NRRL 66182]|nr:hypothetical protein F66182_7268 [Fusarium sp. NRRL 66182]